MVYPKEYWKKAFVFTNFDNLAIDQHLYSVTPRDSVDPLLLAAVLYSRIGTMMRELEGRIAGGEALSRNEITVRELQRMNIIDPRKVSEDQKNKIVAVFELIVKGEKEISEAELSRLRFQLDTLLLETLAMGDRTEELAEGVEDLLNRRIRSGGQHKKVMVQRERKDIKIKLKGAEVIERGSIDNFL